MKSESGKVANQTAGFEFKAPSNRTRLFNNQTVNVRYNGDPGGIFQECIPVVAHGQLVGDTFEANRIEVKHSNTYSEANPDRLAQSKAEQCS
jgi:cytochrome c-type biogenesis protein CcmE